MSSMQVKRRPFKVFFIFGNKKESERIWWIWRLGYDYGVVFGQKITNKQRRNSEVLVWILLPLVSCPKHLEKNVMTWANWYANFISNFSYCDSVIIHNPFFHFFSHFNQLLTCRVDRSVRHLQRLRGHLGNAYINRKHLFFFHSRLTIGYL
jgi:hypothetical protein